MMRSIRRGELVTTARSCLGLSVVLLCLLSAPLAAAEKDESGRPWDWDLAYTLDFGNNVGGGVQTGGFAVGQLLLGLEWKTGSSGESSRESGGRLSAFAVHGDNPSDFVGDLQGVSNIAYGERSDAKINELWWNQVLAQGQVEILVGVHDLNSEFHVIPSAGVFPLASAAIGADMAQTGVNGPSLYPNTSWALRTKLWFGENSYLQLAVYDAGTGSTTSSKGTHLQLDPEDGLLGIGEVGFLGDETKVALGYYRYSKLADDLSESDGSQPKQRSDQGAYVLVELPLYDRLQGFGRLGLSNEDLHEISSGAMLGALLKGVFFIEKGDHMGLLVSHVETGSKARSLTSSLADRETSWQWLYSYPVTESFRVEPDLVIVQQSGALVTTETAQVVGLRLTYRL